MKFILLIAFFAVEGVFAAPGILPDISINTGDVVDATVAAGEPYITGSAGDAQDAAGQGSTAVGAGVGTNLGTGRLYSTAIGAGVGANLGTGRLYVIRSAGDAQEVAGQGTYIEWTVGDANVAAGGPYITVSAGAGQGSTAVGAGVGTNLGTGRLYITGNAGDAQDAAGQGTYGEWTVVDADLGAGGLYIPVNAGAGQGGVFAAPGILPDITYGEWTVVDANLGTGRLYITRSAGDFPFVPRPRTLSATGGVAENTQSITGNAGDAQDAAGQGTADTGAGVDGIVGDGGQYDTISAGNAQGAAGQTADAGTWSGFDATAGAGGEGVIDEMNV